MSTTDQDAHRPHPLPVLIIGAGISGLTLAQHFRRAGIAFEIFERDASASARESGWGLTLNWALPILETLVPADVFARLPETYVNRGAVERGEAMEYFIYDYHTGRVKGKVPNHGQMARVNRQKLKALLAEGVDVQWNKHITSTTSTPRSITAHFRDGTAATGSLLLACDGANSLLRKLTHPSTYPLHRLPIRMLGISVTLTPAQARPIFALTPYFFNGGSSATDAFMYFSFLSCPADPESTAEPYVAQIAFSWPHRAGFGGRAEPLDIPAEDAATVALVKELSSDWAEPFRTIMRDIPAGAAVREIEVRDWPPPREERGRDRVVLLGDATHAMTMFRGEGANHAIADTVDVMKHLGPYLPRVDAPDAELADFDTVRSAIDAYEVDLAERCHPAVLASRQACLDAHDWKRVSDDSPLASARSMNGQIGRENKREL